MSDQIFEIASPPQADRNDELLRQPPKMYNSNIYQAVLSFDLTIK
jgi:hypothetical protein